MTDHVMAVQVNKGWKNLVNDFGRRVPNTKDESVVSSIATARKGVVMIVF
jgi:hypothetical protein